MNKNFLSLLGVALLITSISIGYYFFFYLPEKNIMTYRLECTHLAQKEFEKFSKNTDKNYVLLQPEYKLDNEGRCLYKVHELVTDPNNPFATKYVLDLFTNQRIIEFIGWGHTTEAEKLRYEQEEKKLFK